MSAYEKRLSAKFIMAFVFVGSLTLQSTASEIDKVTGLVKADGWDTVRNNCIACHSAKLITQNHGTRNKWQAIIQWMQETQGLAQLDADTLNTIVTYLTAHYGPKENTRRVSLDPLLMPKNPYARTLQPQAISVEKK